MICVYKTDWKFREFYFSVAELHRSPPRQWRMMQQGLGVAGSNPLPLRPERSALAKLRYTPKISHVQPKHLVFSKSDSKFTRHISQYA